MRKIVSNQKNSVGFSLTELMIVVGVILLLAAIAIPNLLRSKLSANEASAVASLKALNAACVSYSASWNVGFPVGLSNLGPGSPTTASAAGLIDNVLASGMKSGYRFVYVSGAPQNGKVLTYSIYANPSVPQQTGLRYFFTDASGTIRYEYGKAASATSKPI